MFRCFAIMGENVHWPQVSALGDELALPASGVPSCQVWGWWGPQSLVVSLLADAACKRGKGLSGGSPLNSYTADRTLCVLKAGIWQPLAAGGSPVRLHCQLCFVSSKQTLQMISFTCPHSRQIAPLNCMKAREWSL